jgi:hypothetical protein
MASSRLRTSGFEQGIDDGADRGDFSEEGTGTVTWESTVVRSGELSLKCTDDLYRSSA